LIDFDVLRRARASAPGVGHGIGNASVRLWSDQATGGTNFHSTILPSSPPRSGVLAAWPHSATAQAWAA